MSRVLTCDPDGLEAGARGLRQAAVEIGRAADDVLASADATWSGLAALEQAARRAETAELLRALAPPLEEIADSVGEVAATAREHGETVRRHTRCGEELELERSRWVAVGAPPDPVAAAQWAQRIGLLEAELARHARIVATAEEEFDLALRRASDVLADVRARVPQIVWDVGLTFRAVRKAADGWRQVSAAGAMADTLWRLQRGAVPVGERTRYRMERRVARHVRRLKLQPPGWVSKVPGGTTVAGRALPVVAAVDGLRSLWTGGGYTGVRGGTTRLLGGVAVVGIAVAVAAAPAAGAAGLVGVAVYQAWMTGNWFYDNRGRIVSTASRAWVGTRRLGGRGRSGGRTLVTTARDRARAGLDRLRERAGAGAGRSAQRPRPPFAPGAPAGLAPAGAHA